MWVDGELYIGAIRQERKAMGGYSTEASRGFSLPQEDHLETAKREFEDETGTSKTLSERVEPLGKRGVNPNSAFFLANPRKGEGVKFFGVRIYPNEVILRRKGQKVEGRVGEQKVVDDPRRDVYKFTPELQGAIRELNEKIKPEGIRFFHSSLLSETGDGFTLQAIGRLATQKPQNN